MTNEQVLPTPAPAAARTPAAARAAPPDVQHCRGFFIRLASSSCQVVQTSSSRARARVLLLLEEQ
ncbi:hypothetical protein ETH_00013235 [Eimeria tenella]|uniref:Uncharacterized protein n=1 Tax=Eimeria tenella TaxID=5802 RepID=U6KGW2_EIMTE|nr:hypothetical protein ETH_00013235 [Eimeria tenella]CDJ37189.1 hypothetical protein ETH_00013235 [Eimeria tenella]|eukprot:XP_013228027.1 hypothetical protein ETH_00013235 [Eimeria tenella]